MEKIVIFGTGSLARLAYLQFARQGEYEVVAFTVNEEYLEEDRVFGLDVVCYEQIEQTHPPEAFSMFVAVGYRKANKARAMIYGDCKSRGYKLVSCLNSDVDALKHVSVGDNCLIMPNVMIQPYAEIGSDVIIWEGSYIGYKTRIEDHTYIAPVAAIAGNVVIGQYCFIGINATIQNGLTIAPECVIGAGSVIVRDTKPGGVYKAQRAEESSYSSSEQRYFK
jgi:sugar O-acyltransferase (sialic acid O-acetyltransferase NeuD family)